MKNKTRWIAGLGFAVAQAIIGCYVSVGLDDFKRLAIFVMLALSFLTTIAFMSAWGEDQRNLNSEAK